MERICILNHYYNHKLSIQGFLMNIDKFMISYKTRIDYIIREAMNCFYPYRQQVDFKSHYNGYTITYSYHGIS